MVEIADYTLDAHVRERKHNPTPFAAFPSPRMII